MVKWKKGHGKLGVFAPLLGQWQAESDSAQGHVRCTRVLDYTLDRTHLLMTTRWEFGKRAYTDITYIGVDTLGNTRFWSFTSDGKQSTGQLADVSDFHAQAIGFVADMPAGTARQAFWPDDERGFFWAVEAQNKKGWKRFVEHHYRAIE